MRYRSVLTHIHKLLLEPDSEQSPRTSGGKNPLALLPPNTYPPMLHDAMVVCTATQQRRAGKGFWRSRHPKSEAFI